MEKGDKGSTMIRMGVSGWMFLLVPAYPGCPGQTAVKWLLLLLWLYTYIYIHMWNLAIYIHNWSYISIYLTLGIFVKAAANIQLQICSRCLRFVCENPHKFNILAVRLYIMYIMLSYLDHATVRNLYSTLWILCEHAILFMYIASLISTAVEQKYSIWCY